MLVTGGVGRASPGKPSPSKSSPSKTRAQPASSAASAFGSCASQALGSLTLGELPGCVSSSEAAHAHLAASTASTKDPMEVLNAAAVAVAPRLPGAAGEQAAPAGSASKQQAEQLPAAAPEAPAASPSGMQAAGRGAEVAPPLTGQALFEFEAKLTGAEGGAALLSSACSEVLGCELLHTALKVALLTGGCGWEPSPLRAAAPGRGARL